MSAAQCRHASAGCDYPVGECAGLCATSVDQTSGPWIQRAWTCHAKTTVVASDTSIVTGLRVVAECEREDEARLIAAAPELLEAARAAMQCIGELSPTQARVEVAQMLQRALKKATGDQS